MAKREASPSFGRVTEYPWRSSGGNRMRRFETRQLGSPSLRPLDWLADGLNRGASTALEKILRRRSREATIENNAWAKAREILEKVLEAGNAHHTLVPRHAVARFNALALRAPATFYIRGEPGGEEPLVRAIRHRSHTEIPLWATPRQGKKLTNYGGLIFANPAGRVVHLLYDFFRHPARDRLKKCPQCGRWFVDRTRNKSARRCSKKCTSRWWDRTRRTAAGYYQRQTRRAIS